MDNENRRLNFLLVAGVVIILGLAFYPGRPIYRHFKEGHSAAQAQAFFDRGDYRNAVLSARQALQVNPNNVSACRVMAGVVDAAHLPAALDWWQRVVKLSPTVENKLAFAAAGLRYQSPPYPLTTQILDDLSASASNAPDFHILSATLDLSMHRVAAAEAQFETVCQLEPTNQLFQLNLAVIRLGSTNAATAAAARAKLDEFRTDGKLGPPALRSLMADCLQHNDAAGALDYSKQLLAGPQATLNDRLQNLGILKRLQSPVLAAQLNAVQRDSTTNAAMTAQVASWMEVNGFRPETIRWLNSLPAALQTQSPVRLALVDCYLGSTNWPALRAFTASGDWGDVDFLRLAFLSRAWTELGEPLVADGDWSSAVSAASGQLGALTALLELANRWQMAREQEDLLWRIIRRFPDAAWAQQNLVSFYFAAGNTRGLYQFYSERLPFSPKNAELKNNVAATALLLKTNLNQAFQWAAEAYAERTNEPPIVSTYAYALHLQGRDKDGLAVLQKLKASELEQPSVALTYGILLDAAGESNRAASYLKIAQNNKGFLPEEKKLLADAIKRNGEQ